MIRSMTGFGEAETPVEGGLLRVQIKTVNHRFLNTTIRTPYGFDGQDAEIQSWLRPFLSRGHTNVTIAFERGGAATGEASDLPQVDLIRARHYLSELRRMVEDLGLTDPVGVHDLMGFKDLFQSPDRIEAEPLDPAVVKAAVETACAEVVRFREAEGLRLHDDLEGRLSAMSAQLDLVEARAPERLAAERDRLRAAVRELAEQEDIDDERLAREVAWLAEKWDINEELVRFRSHIELFREALDADATGPIGKKLSFLVQELHREANTIGSKANDAAVTHASVALKEEVERLREQVENVE